MRPRQISAGAYVRSIDRALYIIQFLNQDNGVTANYMSTATQIARPTTYRILETLKGLGFIRKDESGRYWLEPEILSLSSGYIENQALFDTLNNFLEGLSISIPWPLSISTRKGNCMVIRASTDLDSEMAASRKLTPGWSMPGLLNSAAGVVYTAFCEKKTRKQILDLIEGEPTSPTLAGLSRKNIEAKLDETRERGYVVIEHNINWNWADRTSAIAVPIFSEGFLFGSLSLRFFRERMSESNVVASYLSSLQDTAFDVGKSLRTTDSSKANQRNPDGLVIE